MFSQPARPRGAEKYSVPSRKMEDSNKPPISKPAWINQPKREQPRKDTRTEKETKPKSHRQRSYSEVENVEILYSAAQRRDKSKHDGKTLNSVLSKSRSEDRLDAPEAQSTEHILTGRSVNSAFSDNNMSAVTSKFTSREAAVKSQKPSTKPLHLGKSFFFCLYNLFSRHLPKPDWVCSTRNLRKFLSCCLWAGRTRLRGARWTSQWKLVLISSFEWVSAWRECG